MGGGGYNGVIVSGTEPAAFAPQAAPLSLGYATFGSDSGHVGNAGRADFAMNDEAVVNFGFAHLKKTHDVALALMMMGYGREPDKTYFAGGSTGGREAFAVVERFPEDYDGRDCKRSRDQLRRRADDGRESRAGGLCDAGRIRRRRAAETCLHHRDACIATGSTARWTASCPTSRRAARRSLRSSRACAVPTGNGGPQRDSCLSESQIATLETLRDGFTLPYQLAYGVTRYYGYNVFQGVDFSSGLGLGDSSTVELPLRFDQNGYLFAQADGYMKYFVSHDLRFNTLGFDVDNPGRYKQRLIDLSEIVGAMNPDLSTFIAHGGKLITMQGLADEVISPNQTIAFYQGLVARYGQEVVDSFMRLYMVPGFQHGNGVFVPAWDELGALDRWVTQGIAPETLIGTDIASATNGRTRPLCRYPGYPRYIGKGNLMDASSFRCASPGG